MHLKSFLSIVFFACSVVSVHAGSLECKDKFVIESKPLTMPSGHTITMQTFNCSNSGAVSPKIPSRAIDNRRFSSESKSKRAMSQCTTSNCLCGVPCFFDECSAVLEPIQGPDCTNLATALQSRSGTFTIPAGLSVAFLLNSCEYNVNTGSKIDTQYCFDDMGVAAEEVFHVCGATQQGACEGTFDSAPFFIGQLNP